MLGVCYNIANKVEVISISRPRDISMLPILNIAHPHAYIKCLLSRGMKALKRVK